MSDVTVTISADPSTIALDANFDDLAAYAEALQERLRSEFPGQVIEVVLGDVDMAVCDDSDIAERVYEIETTGEWLELI